MTAEGGRILVMRALGLGDTYAAVPALRGIGRRWPEAEIVLATPLPLGRLMVAHGLVDRVLPCDALRDGLAPPPWTGPPPDVAVNLHGCGPESHRALAQLGPRHVVAFRCAAAGFAQGPEWDDDEHEVLRWCRLVLSAGGACAPADLRLAPPTPPGRRTDPLPRSPVIVHPGAASEARRWPVARWVAVARALAERGLPVVVTGGPGEGLLCRTVAAAHPAVADLCGCLDLGELASLVAGARLLLCGDTGVAHVATAYGTPSVLLFGPTPPDRWGPLVDRESHRVLWRPLPGDPVGDPHGWSVDVRLARIDVEAVLREVDALVETDGSPSAHEALRG